ncbi:MAG: tol-pal system protein YbgF [Pseudomonadota bacterium]
MFAFIRLLAVSMVVSVPPGLALAAPSMEQQTVEPAGTIEIPFQLADNSEPVRLAQVDDTTFRIGQLEERIRLLNGQLEEMNFMMLEMQEQMRQMQQDNEFRFQELEGGGNRSQASPGAGSDQNQTATAGSDGQSNSSGTLGTLNVDNNGNVVDGNVGNQDETQTAALPASGPQQLYQEAYDYILAGDYPQAEAAFGTYVTAYPDGPQIADAYFWLGESQFSLGAYHDAAKTLLTAHKQFPNAVKAPEMLLKLGMSLAALDNRDTACATYREVLTRYPQSSEAVRNKVAVEQSRMSC